MTSDQPRQPLNAPAEITASLRRGRPILYSNPARAYHQAGSAALPAHRAGIEDARARFGRFAPLLAHLFSEVAPHGTIGSRLIEVPGLKASLGGDATDALLLVKADSELPIAGSIKARGGIHAVLEIAERLVLDANLIEDGDYRSLARPEVKAFFSHHEISVGSTGNLGLSIGMVSAALGFRATVHMSDDAKEWKKHRLRAEGATVIEHAGDYAIALAAGREIAAMDPQATFIDDEASTSLLYGYATAAAELAGQLQGAGVVVDEEHPLIVYLPCGVGGAPTGIALGLDAIFGSAAHCFFAEPVEAPCFLAAMAAEEDDLPSVLDLGLSGITEADGLAVPRASRVAVDIARPIIAGAFTVHDDTMLRNLFIAHRDEGLRIEPSAASGLSGPGMLRNSDGGRYHLASSGLGARLKRATEVVWATGGRLTPEYEFEALRARGESVAANPASIGDPDQGVCEDDQAQA